jgi:hypothetical protein
VVKPATAFYHFREEFPAILCECGHSVSLHSLNIEFHVCLANHCLCQGFSAPIIPQADPVVPSPPLAYQQPTQPVPGVLKPELISLQGPGMIR